MTVATPCRAVTFVCPRCGEVLTLEARREIVAVYCPHRGEPVARMEPLEAPAQPAAEEAPTR